MLYFCAFSEKKFATMKYVRAITRILLVISVLVIAIVAIVQVPKRQCERVEVIPHTENESVVLDQADIEKMIADAGIKTVGTKIKEVDLPAINKLLKENPYIQEINFVHFTGTKLVIDYTLRDILLHVYTNDGDQYFVDKEGVLIPFTKKVNDYLIIANGNIHQRYKKGSTAGKELSDIVALANKLDADEFCQAQFRQIYRNEHNQLELVSTIGNQVILFGSIDNAEEKLDNLKQVYENGLSRKGYNTYAQLDVRYKNRVIAHHR